MPDRATVFDVGYPGIGNLDPALLSALQTAAQDSGAAFYVSSGWRSAAYQEQLLEQAIATYGSTAEAAKWVAPADKSSHVTGSAVDLSDPQTQSWLAQHGAAYGLCLVYENEPWHFELRPDAPRQGCPPMYADAAHDPRMK
ncbi:MAG: M15 family metallopeptidase [Bifidobacteriaceae bacterium]|nr:M15 family metallopeptidase [Bifidobacteriaceae bacterium]